MTTDLYVHWVLSGDQCHLNLDLASELTPKILASVLVRMMLQLKIVLQN